MSKYWKTVLCLSSLTVILNLLAFWKKFCNFYTDHIYLPIANGYGWLMDQIPFAAGEILMYLGMIFLLVFTGICAAFLFLRKKTAFRQFALRYMKCTLGIVVIMLFSYTVLWFIPFRADSLDVRPDIDGTYSTRELRLARAYVVNQTNNIAAKIQRDEEGHIIYDENTAEKCKEAFAAVSKEYPRLRGYCPDMKKALCSDFLDWMSIGGYTYPYTMEITYNRYITRMYFPTLYAHEMAHHKGYYQESDANFISFLVCSTSDDLCLQYSAYLYLYSYLNDAYCQDILAVNSQAARNEWKVQPKLSEQVERDCKDMQAEYEEAYEAGVNAALEENVSSYAAEVSEVGWETQAELLKENNYDGVVRLVLEYYDGILY